MEAMLMFATRSGWKYLAAWLALVGVLMGPTADLGVQTATAGLLAASTSNDGPWTSFSHFDELASPSVLTLQQSSNGYLWVGTTAGVSIFSPQGDWLSLTSADGLGSDIVIDITTDPANARRHWFATTGGATLLDDGGQPMNKVAHSWITFGKPDGLVEYDVSSAAVDADGRIWLGTDRLDDNGNETGFGLSVLNTNDTTFDKTDDAWTTYTVASSDLSNDIIRDIVVDERGVVWIATQSGLNAFKGDIWTVYSTSDGLPSNDIRALLPVGNLLWVATRGGVAVLQGGATPDSKADDQWTTYSTSNSSLAANDTKSLAIDGAKRIWIGTNWLQSGGDTGAGISVLDTGGTPSTRNDDRWTRFTTTQGLASNAVRAAIAPGVGTAWIGTRAGLSRLVYGGSPFAGADDGWITYSGQNHLSGHSVHAAAGAGILGVWLGTEEGLSFLDYRASPHLKYDDRWTTYTTDDRLASNSIRALALDSKGRLWIGTPAGLTVKDTRGSPAYKPDDSQITYTSDSGLVHDQVNDIVIDGAGRAWITTGNYFTGGLQVLDIGNSLTSRSDDKSATFTTASIGLPDSYVTAVAHGRGDSVWMGTQAGAARLNYGTSPFVKGDDRLTVFHPGSSGLAEDSVRDVGVDQTGNAWFALATAGVSVYSSGGAWVTFTRQDGLAINALDSILIDRVGQVWLGTNGGGVSILNHRGTLSNKGDDRWTTGAGGDRVLSGNITTLTADQLGQVWIGTLGGGASVYSTVTFRRANLPLTRR